MCDVLYVYFVNVVMTIDEFMCLRADLMCLALRGSALCVFFSYESFFVFIFREFSYDN